MAIILWAADWCTSANEFATTDCDGDKFADVVTDRDTWIDPGGNARLYNPVAHSDDAQDDFGAAAYGFATVN